MAHAPSQGSRFFHFDIHNFQNVTASGVILSPPRGPRPLREILDPPLDFMLSYPGISFGGLRLNSVHQKQIIMFCLRSMCLGVPLDLSIQTLAVCDRLYLFHVEWYMCFTTTCHLWPKSMMLMWLDSDCI